MGAVLEKGSQPALGASIIDLAGAEPRMDTLLMAYVQGICIWCFLVSSI